MTTKQLFNLALLSSAVTILAGCGGTPPVTETKAPEPPPPAMESVLPAGTPIERTSSIVSAASQKTYKIETVEDDREKELRALAPGARDVTPEVGAAPGDNYRGTARKAAKLSIANAATETFADLKDLIATLEAHKAMVNHTPPIKTTATSNRVKEEKRNIKLKAFLYAASREDDNDFHLIVGRAPGASPAVYFTIELSGLPPAGSAAFPKLKAARDSFKSFFKNSMPGTSYDFYTPPIPVEIEGSLFFDMSHASGSRPGPSSLRPKMPVVWEVHPITKIIFEP
jgi:hypothetical protein